MSALSEAEVAVDAMASPGLKVWGDMTVEVALSIMAGARVAYLPVCDEDARCTGLVTHAQLTAVRDGAMYTDRLRLRDLPDDTEPCPSPSARRPAAELLVCP
ncbi:CBS domain-containing protein [Streptomyces sp. NPDC008313]|uniref:CBS domain-containing protein n=1 Tax=Streptomyces sp. NPDC008313 TaxID=3364826 RepID=UPI0036EF3943